MKTSQPKNPTDFYLLIPALVHSGIFVIIYPFMEWAVMLTRSMIPNQMINGIIILGIFLVGIISLLVVLVCSLISVAITLAASSLVRNFLKRKELYFSENLLISSLMTFVLSTVAVFGLVLLTPLAWWTINPSPVGSLSISAAYLAAVMSAAVNSVASWLILKSRLKRSPPPLKNL